MLPFSFAACLLGASLARVAAAPVNVTALVQEQFAAFDPSYPT